MTAVHLSAFKLPDLTATYQAYLAAKALLAAYQKLMDCSPRDKDPSWEALVLIHRTPGLGRWATKTLAQSLFIPETSRWVVWSNER